MVKLLLTSSGLSNDTIATALTELVGLEPKDTKIVFIPTAMNVGSGDKDWFINDLYNIKKRGYKAIDIVDISALPKEIWLPRIEDGDVLFFSGGNTYHLMRWLTESGLAALLPELLKTRVYAGISAGSIVTNPTLTLTSSGKKLFYKEHFGYADEKALGFVEFYTRPHLNSKSSPEASFDTIAFLAKNIEHKIYALDDMSAIKIDGDKVEVVTEGQWQLFN